MGVESWGRLPGKLVVVSGPSGSGKSSLIRRVLEISGLNLRLSVSATTRAPRPGEAHGIDYSFLTEEQFHELVAGKSLLEYAEYNGCLYGTPAEPVYDSLKGGRSVILEIEVKGALQIREQAPTALFVFVKTPSFCDLQGRLRGRGTESEAAILRRLRKAREELAEAHWYDHVLVNDDFDRCVEDFIRVLRSNGCGG